MQEITVFCTVWHKDPQRHALLAGHRDNLRRQTVPVRPLYVLDGGDVPPDWMVKSFTRTARPPSTRLGIWR
jgi:hypothetical protein